MFFPFIPHQVQYTCKHCSIVSDRRDDIRELGKHHKHGCPRFHDRAAEALTELERELEQESAAAAAADAAEEARLTTIIHDAELAVAVTVDELSDHFSGLAVDHGEAPSAAAAATAAASASAPTEALPAISTAQEFRAASQTAGTTQSIRIVKE